MARVGWLSLICVALRPVYMAFATSVLQNSAVELRQNQREIDHYRANVSAILIAYRKVATQINAADKQTFGCILKPWLFATQTI